MDTRQEEGGAPDRQPPQKTSLDQRLNYITPLQAALAYAARGWRIVPLHSIQPSRCCSCATRHCRDRGKHPRVREWPKEATTDPAQIKLWWDHWQDSNVGIVTGRDSGLMVIDVDPRNGGTESLKRLQEAYAPFDTYTVSTGGGGWHFYFEHPGGYIPCSANLEAGLDIKADGGLVAAAPSLHLSGARYRVERDVPITELPGWLLERLRQARNGAASLPAIGVTLGQLRVPARIKKLIAEGIQAGEYPSRSEALFAVIRAMVMAGHTDDEISGILLNPTYALSAKAGEKGLAWLQAEIARGRTKGHVNGGPSAVESESRQAPAHPPLRLLTIEEVKARPKPAWLIESLIPQGALCVLFGPSGCGKSFITLDWSLSIARGLPWLGHAVAQGLIVYIAAEGAAGLGQRILAWEAARGCTAANVWIIDQAINLLDKGNATALIDAISQALPAQPTLIVLDTLSRNLPGADENAARDMGQAIATLDEIRLTTGACVLVVHHSTKASGVVERGSSVIRGAADTMLKVERTSDVIEVIVDKQKDAEPAQPISLKLVSYGDSCTLEVAGANQDQWLTENEATLVQVLAEAGEPLRNKGLWKTSGLSERTFNRVLGELKRKRLIINKSGAYELTDDAKRCHCHELPTSCHDSSSTVTAKLSHPLRGDS